MNKETKIKNLVQAGIFAAIICLSIAFLFHIPIGSNGGYIHIGDAFIYLASSLLPYPYGILASAIGAGLADGLVGAIIWIIPSIIIKSIIASLFTSNEDRVLCKRNIVMIFVGGFVTVMGYYLAEAIIFKNIISPLVGIIPNAIQAIVSGALFIVIGLFIDRNNLKNKLVK